MDIELLLFNSTILLLWPLYSELRQILSSFFFLFVTQSFVEGVERFKGIHPHYSWSIPCSFLEKERDIEKKKKKFPNGNPHEFSEPTET